MRRFLSIIGVLALMMALAACGSPTEEQPEEQVDYEIAMVTDSRMIMDGGYSEEAWTAVSEFGAENGISHKYYKASEASDEAYSAAIDNAVSNGAKVIVADGYSFEHVVYRAQKEYPDVKFILIDAEPVDSESGETDIAENTMTVMFASEQAGYLAGYSAVKEGMSELGFFGSAAQSAIMDYGYGFLQGAEDANEGSNTKVNVRFHCCDEDDDRDDVLAKSTDWYEDGTQVVFACGAYIEQPVIEAAELIGEKVIGYETDKSSMSDTVMTSAVKDISVAIKAALKTYISDEFPGGEIVYYNAENEGLWLEWENGRFENFAETDYEEIYEMLADGSLEVSDHDGEDIEDLDFDNIDVDVE